MDGRSRAYMDVLVACPGLVYPIADAGIKSRADESCRHSNGLIVIVQAQKRPAEASLCATWPRP